MYSKKYTKKYSPCVEHFRKFLMENCSELENLKWKILKCAVILVVESTTNNVSKTLSCIKIHPLELEISSILCQKTCEIEYLSNMKFSRFHTFFDIQSMISSDPANGL